MPSYKLSYFNSRGFGEVSRLLFALAGQEYEDIRFTQETWPEFKPTSPLGQAPFLTVDGKHYGQSSAISRYLARTFGLYGKSDIEALEIDQVLGIIQDIFNVLIKVYYEKDPERKSEFETNAKEERIPMYLNMLETILTANGSTGYFVGNTFTLADFAVYDTIDKLKDFGWDMHEKCPLVKKSVEMVGADPKIKAWVEKRPKTDM